MTREKAIKVLNTYDVNFDEYTAEEIADAIDMAIDALSEPSECDTCKYKDKPWDFIKCDTCTVGNSNYEPSKVDYRTDESANIGTEVNDLISRADALMELNGACSNWEDDAKVAEIVHALPSADAEQGEWIPCSKKMPKELERVNATWLNHNPPFYYQHIKDIPQTDTAVYYRGKWYWWDATVIDILAEYGEDCNAEQIDKDIEVIAWMPLPTPYKGGDDE